MILGPDGDKMSKSKGNVVNPMETIESYGADTLRLYILFIGDYEQSTPWSESGVKGARRFLEKVWRLQDKVKDQKPDEELTNFLHKIIDGVDTDIEATKFNTAISKLMTFVNEASKKETIAKATFETFLKLLNPFAPHISEELNQNIGNNESLVFAAYPEADPERLKEEKVTIVLSVNGKMRDKIEAKKDEDKEKLEELALANERVQKFIEGKSVQKIIVVPNRLVNVVAQ